MKHIVWIIAGTLALGGCNPAVDTKSAEAGVAEFHQAMDGGRYAQIYDQSDPEMKKAISRDEFIKLMTIFHTKLGSFQSGKTVGWNDNATTSGHFVTMNRDVRFQRGAATEQFVFRVDGAHPTLVGYHVNSDLLISS